MILTPADLKTELCRRAAEEGFAACRITEARLEAQKGRELLGYLRAGHHGDMAWMVAKAGRRRSPHALWREARTAVMLAMPYHDSSALMPARGAADQGVISVYAQGADYHDLIKKRLKRLARWLAEASGEPLKVFVDTAPLMEKPLAAKAGLGWQGKHTNLVSRDLGSWFFLGAILTAASLPQDEPEQDHCGTCAACITACPTGAIPAPYRLDARACISYLTIEHKGTIPECYRAAIGNRIYGCDDCLAACPWNKFAVASSEAKLAARETAKDPSLAELLALDEAGFRARFSGSPIKRIGWARFRRNLLIAAGNARDPHFLPEVEASVQSNDEVIRDSAQWAREKILAV